MIPVEIGPYVIHEKLGSGGMGTVYLARHKQTGQIAAVKVLPTSMAQDEGFVERFQREIDVLKKLSNPHIVRLFESGADHGTYFYAMEYVAGRTMTSRLQQEGRLPWREVVEVGVQVCRALKAAHDAGIIHRDLKPSNLITTEDGTVKLMDFGVAQVFAEQRLTVTGGIVGTAEFMSPEQAEGKRVTRQSDLYSLGAVLYALLCGKPPFTGATVVDLLQKHRFGRFDPPLLHVPEIPRELNDIICQLLEKEPAKRPPDALVLSRRLEQMMRRLDYRAEEQTRELRALAGGEGTGGGTATAGGGDATRIQGNDLPGSATIMRQMVRRELEELDRGSLFHRMFNNVWVLMLLLLAVAAGVWAVMLRQTVSRDELFARGVELMEQPAGSAWLRARDECFMPLLAADRAAWEPRVAPYLRQVELYDLARGKSRRAANASAAAMPEIERLLSLALHARKIGETSRAERLLEDLIALLSASPEEARTAELCQALLEEWREENRALENRFALAYRAAEKARALAESDPQQSRRLWQSLLELYANEPALGELTNEARRALQPAESKGE